jgi:hypothetical protein
MIIKETILLIALAAGTQLAMAQCATEERASTVLCPVVTEMRGPFAAIARLNDEQVEAMKAAVAAMKR